MKSKAFFRVLTLLALMFSVLGASQPAQAKAEFIPSADAEIVLRDMTYWDATYSGTVSFTRYEKWSFQFTEANDFTVTVTPTSGDLAPLITLLDANGNELSTWIGSLTSSQPAGEYYVLIQPEAGSGSYNLAIRKTVPQVELSSSIELNPAKVRIGESAQASVHLSNLPSGGLTSAEFTCDYDPAFIEVSGIAEAGLFGTDAVTIVNGPGNGTFIFAIAASNGQKAVSSGSVFGFTVKALQTGQASIICRTRVSTGDKNLTSITSIPATLTIAALQGTVEGQVAASKLVTVRMYDATSAEVATITAAADGKFSAPLEVGGYTLVASAEGYLKAQGYATITSGTTTTMPLVSLLAGDIDGNDVIDQYDAMTIGMSYNMPVPAAADLNNDANINVLDLELLAANYHKSGALAW